MQVGGAKGTQATRRAVCDTCAQCAAPHAVNTAAQPPPLTLAPQAVQLLHHRECDLLVLTRHKAAQRQRLDGGHLGGHTLAVLGGADEVGQHLLKQAVCVCVQRGACSCSRGDCAACHQPQAVTVTPPFGLTDTNTHAHTRHTPRVQRRVVACHATHRSAERTCRWALPV
jgi:hypothetical protein